MATQKMQKINDEIGPLIEEQLRGRIVEVSEETFRRKLLPIAVARYTNVEHDIELTNWQAITGEEPTFGVRVMRGKECIFTTPPLILKPEIKFEGSTLLERLKTAEAREKQGLPKGDIMDGEALKPNLTIKDLGAALNTWVLIFRYYGIRLIPKDAEDGEDVAELKVDTDPKVEVVSTPEPVGRWDDDEDDDGDVL